MSTTNKSCNIIILGAGPAGLTAALELLRSGHTSVTIVEMEDQVGGLSRTVVYKGNRMDIGGHRFFSKSEKIMQWWQQILPLQSKNSLKKTGIDSIVGYLQENGPDPEKEDKVMLLRHRLSRIFYLRRFFDYPVSLHWTTLKNLGFLRVIKMCFGYVKSCIFPIKPEKNLEDFIVNRFGRELYNTFFRDYTKKVWGVPCQNISADWGAQRIKGLSIARVVRHAVLHLFHRDKTISQKNTDTSLIEQFFYPKFGPGHLWETVAQEAVSLGATLLLSHTVVGIEIDGNTIKEVELQDHYGEKHVLPCDVVMSSLPLKDVVSMCKNIPSSIQEISDGLVYRDFITVGVLVTSLRLDSSSNGCVTACSTTIKDNWIYIQEPDVYLGRIQIFNNWSPYLVSDSQKVWLGLEYFVNEGDKLWNMSDNAFKQMAIEELVSIGFIHESDVEDTTILRIKKAYPAYFGTYTRISELQDFFDTISNFYPIGRNGMHRYNNMDHSMLSAMYAVECLKGGTSATKAHIWKVNAEKKYHESS